MFKKIIVLGWCLMLLMCCLMACDDVTPIESMPPELSSEEKDMLKRVERELGRDYPEYVDVVTQEAILLAKGEIDMQIEKLLETSEQKSGYYLSLDTDGYLCLTVEVIVPIPEEERDELRGCGDHEHLFYMERLCDKMIGTSES